MIGLMESGRSRMEVIFFSSSQCWKHTTPASVLPSFNLEGFSDAILSDPPLQMTSAWGGRHPIAKEHTSVWTLYKRISFEAIKWAV